MAQLPPKVPSMTPNWPDFSHGQKILPPTATAETLQARISTAASQNPSWVDEFLDFSTAKRAFHRRSISESIAFLKAPMVQECGRPAQPPGADGAAEFDRFDDDQFMSMFNDDIAPPASMAPTLSCSNPSSPSDHNSINEEKDINPANHDRRLQPQIMKIEPHDQEEESSCKSDEPVAFSHAAATDNPNDKIVDPKRIKRILANRQSAQRSRVRKLQYISELERSVTSLQAEVSVMSPRVAFLDHQRLVLNVDNSVLKQRLAALAQDKIFKDAHQEALKREIERLRQVYYQQQNLKKMENAATQSQPPFSEARPSTEKGQLVN